MSDNIIPILQKSKLFAGFSPEQLEEVVAHLAPNRLSLESHAVVYARGKPSDRCWLIRSGNLTVMRPSLRKPFRKMIYHVGSVERTAGQDSNVRTSFQSLAAGRSRWMFA